jgi:uncharacterized lipoprotein YajG
MKIGTMKHWIACLSLFSLWLVTGCDTVNHTQLQVAVPTADRKTRTTVPASERETVKQIVTELANRRHFEDRTALSLIPDTICSFAQPDVRYPISIRAWVDKPRIIIDIVQTRPDTAGETEAYRTLREQLQEDLEKQFGSRALMVPRMQQAQSRTTTKQ